MIGSPSEENSVRLRKEFYPEASAGRLPKANSRLNTLSLVNSKSGESEILSYLQRVLDSNRIL
jgi:hypothetical protein